MLMLPTAIAQSSRPPPEVTPDGWINGRFIVLGMTYPHYSAKYAENVCTGAINTATGELVRIHPVPQRYLEPGARFRTFQEMTCRYRAHDVDNRPESIRVDPASIATGRIVNADDTSERTRWLTSSPHLFRSVEDLRDRWRSTHVSLGIVRPKEILDLRLEPRPPSALEEWTKKARQVHNQARLPLLRPVKPIDFPDTKFMVKWKCDDPRCDEHEMGLNFWSSEQTCVVKLVGRDAVIDKLVYTATNPVIDDLVDRVHHWPGVNGLAALLNGRTLRATRPLHFFRRDGSMPEELEMAVTIPAELGPDADVLAELRDRVRAVEDERAAERQQTGRRVLGRRAVLAQSWRERPTTSEPRRNLRPQVASRSRWARIETLLRNRAFAAEYADARERWRAGIPAVFPPGTYWLQRFASVTVLET